MKGGVLIVALMVIQKNDESENLFIKYKDLFFKYLISLIYKKLFNIYFIN